MDHAVCSIGAASVACFTHKELKQVFENRPRVGFAIWRETLVDAAIFREAITNNSSREAATRMAHLFSELFYRAEASKLTHNHAIEIPITLIQLGEALGMSIATVNRALSIIRETGFVDFQGGALRVHNWTQLARFAEFDPAYLHLRKAPLA
jgi:CRP-like cAMP-binding protein